MCKISEESLTRSSESVCAQVEDLEEGLAAAAWSSNQKLLAVVTCPGSLLLMNEVRPASIALDPCL